MLALFLFIISQDVLGLHVYVRQLLLEIKASYNLALKQTATGEGYGLPPLLSEMPVPAVPPPSRHTMEEAPKETGKVSW